MRLWLFRNILSIVMCYRLLPMLRCATVILLLLFHSCPAVKCDLLYTIYSSVWQRVAVCCCIFMCAHTIYWPELSFLLLSGLSPVLTVSKPKRCPLSFSCLTFNRFINAPFPLAKAGHFILLEISIWLSGGGSALYMLMER